MKIYFAGSDGVQRYNTLLTKEHAANRLESYYTLRPKAPSSGFSNLLLDSGGFVARTKNIVIRVQDYAAYINAYNIKLAFNLDTNNVIQTLENQKYLNANTKAYIIPVYHMSDWIEHNDLLRKFIADGFDYIGLGGTAGIANANSLRTPFFNHCFSIARDSIKLHGLGVTSKGMLLKYPFYSVDSTSWLSAARYGNSIDKTDKRVTMFRAKHNHYLTNTQTEIQHWVNLERQMTELWESRKVTWK